MNGTSTGAKSIQPHRSTASETVFDDTVYQITPHPWGIFFTILGTVLLDFDADACQSPARAYLLDVTIPGLFYGKQLNVFLNSRDYLYVRRGSCQRIVHIHDHGWAWWFHGLFAGRHRLG